jgi:hypothetical protein
MSPYRFRWTQAPTVKLNIDRTTEDEVTNIHVLSLEYNVN